MEPGFRVPISEALAGGRAGRGLLASIAGLDPSDFMFAVHQKNAGRPLLVELVNDAVGHWLATPRRQHDREFLALLGEFINSYAHGLESKWRGFDDVLIAASPELMKIGQDLSARTNLQWWAASIDRTNQRGYLRGKDAGFHTSTALIDKSFAALKSGGAWWVCPGDALTTSRGPIQGSPSVISAAPDDHWLKDDKHTLWSVRVDPEATVYEVHQRSDWVRLLQQYPYEASNIVTFDWAEDVPVGSRLLIPDWSEVARDWDGVHVSVAGYLNAAYTPLMLDTARYGLLTGWHPDATVWLTEKARTLLPAS